MQTIMFVLVLLFSSPQHPRGAGMDFFDTKEACEAAAIKYTAEQIDQGATAIGHSCTPVTVSAVTRS